MLQSVACCASIVTANRLMQPVCICVCVVFVCVCVCCVCLCVCVCVCVCVYLCVHVQYNVQWEPTDTDTLYVPVHHIATGITCVSASRHLTVRAQGIELCGGRCACVRRE